MEAHSRIGKDSLGSVIKIFLIKPNDQDCEGGFLPPLSEATSCGKVKSPLSWYLLALQYFQEEKCVALSVETGDAILDLHGEDILRSKDFPFSYSLFSDHHSPLKYSC